MALEPLEILSLTVNVEAANDTVTVADATVLTDLNCRAGAVVTIGGQAGFVKARLTTTTFQLSRAWWGATASVVNCDIAPYTPEMASRVALSQQLATYNADLVLFEAYRRGFVNFFSTSVDLSNPGTGHAGLNNLTPADATAMVVSDVDATGQSQSARFQELSRGDMLTLRTVDTEAFAVYTLTAAPTAETGFTKILGLTFIEGAGTFSADAKFTIEVTNIAEGLEFDAQVADIAARAAYDSEVAGYRVLVNDTGAGRAGVFTLVTPGGSPVWEGPAYIDGPKGDAGDKGWSPRHAIVADGARRVLQLAGYVGGAGDAPTANIGEYVGAAGYEADIANGIDIRGTQGLPLGHRLTFSTSTTDADPGAGKIRADNPTFGSITKLWINNADADAIDITGWLDRFDDAINASGRGYLTLRDETDTAVMMQFSVTGGVTDKTGYREIPVAPVSGAVPADAAEVVGGFSNNGKDGLNGAGTVASVGAGPGILVDSTDATAPIVSAPTLVVGPASATASSPVLFDGATGKLLKGGAYASQGEAEAGTNTAKFMTPERTAQAIAALAEGYDPNTAVLALELAGVKDSTVALADGLADAFASVGNIDAGNSSNYQFDGALDVIKPTADPDGTLLLLHMDGTDASTTFTDSSYYARTVTAVGNAQIDTAQKKFGTASALFDGSGDRLSVADSADFDFGTADFTVEGFVRFGSTPGDMSLCEIGTFVDGFEFGVGADLIYAYMDGDTTNNITVTTWATSTWYHLAVCRDGDDLRTFVNGALVGTRDVTGRSISTSDGLRVGGRSSGALAYNGWIDEFRVSNVARYTAAFTPPAAPVSGPQQNNMTVRSSARVVSAAPDLGRLAVQIVENEAITINTDVVVKYSRDGGSTFETATLALLMADGATKLYQDSNIDLSGQTSDTDMVWQIETANNVDVYLSGVVDQQK